MTYIIRCQECQKTIRDEIGEFSAMLQANMHVRNTGHSVDISTE